MERKAEEVGLVAYPVQELQARRRQLEMFLARSEMVSPGGVRLSQPPGATDKTPLLADLACGVAEAAEAAVA